MLFDYFAKKKAEKEKQEKLSNATQLYTYSKISRKEYLDKLYAIDEAVWMEEMTEVERAKVTLTQDYNRGNIDRDRYKTLIKEYDLDAWMALATADEKEEHQINHDYTQGLISDREYDRKMHDLRKMPYVDFAGIDFNDDGKHSIELDYNSYFVEKLRSVGHVGETDDDVVNSWFVAFCTSIAAESESVIVTNPDDIQKVNYEKNGNKSEYR